MPKSKSVCPALTTSGYSSTDRNGINNKFRAEQFIAISKFQPYLFTHIHTLLEGTISGTRNIIHMGQGGIPMV